MTQVSCAILGACKAESGQPRCSRCVRHAYAPGTIEAHQRPAGFWSSLIAEGLKVAGVCAVVAFSVGYAAGKGWL